MAHPGVAHVRARRDGIDVGIQIAARGFVILLIAFIGGNPGSSLTQWGEFSWLPAGAVMYCAYAPYMCSVVFRDPSMRRRMRTRHLAFGTTFAVWGVTSAVGFGALPALMTTAMLAMTPTRMRWTMGLPLPLLVLTWIIFAFVGSSGSFELTGIVAVAIWNLLMLVGLGFAVGSCGVTDPDSEPRECKNCGFAQPGRPLHDMCPECGYVALPGERKACPTCAYPLRGLPKKSACPECGEPLNSP